MGRIACEHCGRRGSDVEPVLDTRELLMLCTRCRSRWVAGLLEPQRRGAELRSPAEQPPAA